MHPALQAQSSAAGAPAGTAPTRPAPAADPTPVRTRWTPRLRLSEHPLAFTFLVVLIAAAVAQLLTPAPAQAIPVVSPIVNGVSGLVGGVANDIFVKGFGAILEFIFGKTLTELAQSFLKDLLDVTPLAGSGAPAGLGQLHSAIDGAGWGLLTLSFTGAVALIIARMTDDLPRHVAMTATRVSGAISVAPWRLGAARRRACARALRPEGDGRPCTVPWRR